MSKTMWTVIVFLVILLLGTIGFDIFKQEMIKKALANFKMPPAAVETIKAESQTWNPKLYAVGTLKAINGVNVSSEVAGQVTDIRFKSGDHIDKGQSLVQLDDAFDLSKLRNDMATLRLAKAQYARQDKLIQSGATSHQELDEALAKMEESQAIVKGDKVTIDKKNIRAPFSGKLGIRQINIGQYVTAGQSLVLLQSMDPLYVDFYLPEQDLKHVYVGQKVELTLRAYPNKNFIAKLTAINSAVDESTRNFMVRAEVPNKQGQLYPGVFANIYVLLPQQNHVVTLPQTAIAYTLYGDSVYLIKHDGNDSSGKPILRAVQKTVTLGEQRGSDVQILSGLNAGDEVVNAGQVKLQNNSLVVINNTMRLKEGA